MFDNKIFAFILCLALLPGAPRAQTVELNPNRPEQYVVQKGDTLWDIAGRFLRFPWHWPEIWDVNPAVENPHLIYPGDELYLTYRDGRPVVSRRGGGSRTVKLSPEARSTPLDGGAIPTIPIDAIRPFLIRPRVVDKGELDAAPYIVSLGKEHLIGGAGSKVYVRGPSFQPVPRYSVLRSGQVYRDVGPNGEVLGYEALHIGDAVLEREGDPATLRLTSTKREVLVGDRVLPPEQGLLETTFALHTPKTPMAGQIIAVVDGVTQIGQFQVVVINRGERDGIRRGEVLAVYQRGETISDRFARRAAAASSRSGVYGADGNGYELVTLPDERAGVILVFRPFERVSYALVMEVTRAVNVYDVVTNP